MKRDTLTPTKSIVTVNITSCLYEVMCPCSLNSSKYIQVCDIDFLGGLMTGWIEISQCRRDVECVMCVDHVGSFMAADLILDII